MKSIPQKKSKRMTCGQYIAARIAANRKRVAESSEPDLLRIDAPTCERQRGQDEHTR